MHIQKTPRIALFDSGLGGLMILKPLLETYPADYIFLADTANMPYGNKNPEQIKALSARAIAYLASQQPDLIIIACFTVSSWAYEQLKQQTTIPLVSMIDLIVQPALQATISGRIGIMATAATIQSRVLQQTLLKKKSALTIIEQACPELASAIENGAPFQEISELLIKYTTPLVENKIDTLILGCTHYEAVKDQIAMLVGPSVTIISVQDLITGMIQQQINHPKTTPDASPTARLLTTGSYESFRLQVEMLFSDTDQSFYDRIGHIIL